MGGLAMKPFKGFVATVMLSVFVLTFAGSAFANNLEKLPDRETPIYLKIDRFYILYTHPHAPFVDEKNRLLIPVRAIRDLMGGTVAYDAMTRSASVNFVEHTFRFTIGSTTVVIDGEKTDMDTIPVLIDGAMFVPIRFILDRTDMEWTWNAEHGYLHIRDERVVKGKPFEQFETIDMAQIVDEHAIHLKSYAVNREDRFLTVTGINVSGKDIEAGKADIQPLTTSDDGFSVDSYNRPSYPPLPLVKANGEVTKEVFLPGLSTVLYIISVGREMK